ELLPFIKAIEWNEAAPPGEGFAEGRLRVDALGLGIDVGEADLDVLRTERHQGPTHNIEAALPGPGIVTHDRQVLARRGVPIGRDVGGRPLRRDREDELDFADIGGETGAS